MNSPRETLNADPERVELNRQVIGTVDLDDVKERLGAAGVSIRKDSVLAIDVFATASPEFFKENHPDDIRCKLLQDSLIQFLEKEFGKDNLVILRAHHDETSPHWHATIVPIREKTIKVGRKIKTERTENRLCAKDWLGGDRHTLSELQTRFAESMKHLGLQEEYRKPGQACRSQAILYFGKGSCKPIGFCAAALSFDQSGSI